MLDKFVTVKQPAADLLIASYLGYKAPHESGDPRTVREAARGNSAVLGDMNAAGVKLQRRSLLQMPAYLRNPEKMAQIERMKAEWGKAKA